MDRNESFVNSMVNAVAGASLSTPGPASATLTGAYRTSFALMPPPNGALAVIGTAGRVVTSTDATVDRVDEDGVGDEEPAVEADGESVAAAEVTVPGAEGEPEGGGELAALERPGPPDEVHAERNTLSAVAVTATAPVA